MTTFCEFNKDCLLGTYITLNYIMYSHVENKKLIKIRSLNMTFRSTAAQQTANVGTPDTFTDEEAVQHTEGVVARTIEQQTAKLPSDLFLWAALGALGVSAYLEFTGNQEKSRFIGQWVAPFLLLGLYNKVVKVAGSDRLHQ
jgi:hypothetical protein